LPTFKVQLEIKHRSPLLLPVTLRAHVVTQQDMDDIAAWIPLPAQKSGDEKVRRRAISTLTPEMRGHAPEALPLLAFLAHAGAEVHH
jgi:hypothetical protein